MGSAARSSRMSITFQKNFWGLVVPEPWSSKTSVDEVSPNCAEAPVATRATKRAINAAEVFIFVCIRMVVRLLRLVGLCGGSVGSVERSKKNLQGLVFQTSCAFVWRHVMIPVPPTVEETMRHVLFAFPVDATRLSVSSGGGKNRRPSDDCRDIGFKYAITSEIDGCIQSRFRVYHLLEAVKKSRVPRLFRRSPFTTSRGLPRPPESRFSHSQRRFTMASKRITKELQVRARTNVAPAAIATRP